MNSTNFVIIAYVIGLGLLWGYAATLLWQSIRSNKTDNHAGGPQ
jgi:hypothetical protein